MELLVVVGITVMLSSIVMAYSGASRRQTQFYLERARIGQFILSAKSLTLSARTRGALGHPCGYGVIINASVPRLSLFSYALPASAVSALETCAKNDGSRMLRDDLVETVKEQIEMPKEISINTAADDSLEKIFFLAPDPRTFLWAKGAIIRMSGNIYLETNKGQTSATVKVTPFGEVNF